MIGRWSIKVMRAGPSVRVYKLGAHEVAHVTWSLASHGGRYSGSVALPGAPVASFRGDDEREVMAQTEAGVMRWLREAGLIREELNASN